MRPLRNSIICGVIFLAFGFWVVLFGANSSTAEVETAIESYDGRHSMVVARGVVDVDGGMIQIAASRDGVIREVCVKEGQRVRKGDVLLIVDDRAARVALDVLEAEWFEAEAARHTAAVRVTAVRREFERIERLHSSEAATSKELVDARDTLRLAEAEQAERVALLASTKARLAQGKHELERHTVRAPVDGVIVRRLARPGDGTSTLNVTTLFWLAPTTPLMVRAEIEEVWARRVAPGQSVKVIVEEDERIALTGHVVRVGRAFGPRRVTVYDTRDRADVRVVEALIDFDDDPSALLLGQRVVVHIDAKMSGNL